jgi:glycosyltransferase involved in cell wall biosynthesis
MKYLLITPTLTQHDAVSNDVMGQHEFLIKEGHEVYLYAENFHQTMGHLVVSELLLDQLLSSQSTNLVYHHSIEWVIGFSMLVRFKGKLFIKYHNITPPEFFAPYDNFSEGITRNGRLQTKKIVKLEKTFRYLSDSLCNAEDLKEAGVADSMIRIVPPFHKVDKFNEISTNATLAERLSKSGGVKLLFVGRLSPNKGHIHLIQTVKRYIEVYGEDIELHLVGLIWSIEKFLKPLEELVNQNRLGGHIYVHTKVSAQDLKTFYKYCDIFLLMSEHEGFCVPIVEAQFHGLPIIALDRTAVKETLGPNQILFEEINYNLFAAAVRSVAHNKEYRRYLVENGSRNVKRFDRDVIATQLMTALSGE